MGHWSSLEKNTETEDKRRVCIDQIKDRIFWEPVLKKGISSFLKKRERGKLDDNYGKYAIILYCG